MVFAANDAGYINIRSQDEGGLHDALQDMTDSTFRDDSTYRGSITYFV